MKYQQLIAQFKSDPCDKNLAAVQDWLTKCRKDTQSVYEVVFALIATKPNEATFSWFDDWLKTRPWFPLNTLTHVRNPEWHQWLIQYASSHPERSTTGAVWRAFLMNFKYKTLIEGASDWLVNYGQGQEATHIASMLLHQSNNRNVKQKAIALLRENPDEFAVADLISAVGDAESIELGAKMLSTMPGNEQVVAAALLENNAIDNWDVVENWLQRKSKERGFKNILAHLMDKAPLLVAPLAFAWIEEHPRPRNVSELFKTALALNPSQEFFDLLWSWLSTRTKRAYCPELLSLLFCHFGKFKTPPDAVLFADVWLTKNPKHALFSSILCGAIREENTEHRLKLARQWLASNDDLAKGHLLMNLRRRSSLYFSDEALAWSNRHPNEMEAQVIKAEYFRESATQNPPKVEDIKYFVSPWLFAEERLCALIKAGDAEAIAQGKDFLARSKIELRYSESARCRKVPVLSALFECIPTDGDVVAEVERWFESDDEVCEEHLLQMRKVTGK